MAISEWTPPARARPSAAYLGETSPEPIYAAIGKATTQWEHNEVVLCRLFQFFCETPSFAASQVYGEPTGFAGRLALVQVASDEFFLRRPESIENLEQQARADALVRAFAQASFERNKIVHAMVSRPQPDTVELGYYLTPSYYSTKKRKFDLEEGWPMGGNYFYRSAEILRCFERFEDLLNEGMHLWLLLQETHGVPEGVQYVPRVAAPQRLNHQGAIPPHRRAGEK
ncbi:MAG: hypothetical protein EOS51_01725 [Mesorhizobium sp.]|uniref:hypothetical protein n=1 Tax=unclassified Mesorhizobium TaxID=325217 RepID=UPI000FE4D2E1|nr:MULTISPECIES: hypothetical protein [unclassified Mesorhizobium]RWC24969.1 MAG: hypothetical protein EOS51_01725 [Mesorhizobium sp.]TGU00256.1 hypothetical protein EN807_10560 [Mesorhizobium sp. M5C.F.Ca.ET.164.01.1.1]